MHWIRTVYIQRIEHDYTGIRCFTCQHQCTFIMGTMDSDVTHRTPQGFFLIVQHTATFRFCFIEVVVFCLVAEVTLHQLAHLN